MNKRTTAAVAVYIVLEKDGKVLIGRRANTGYMDGHYQVFAGHMEFGEIPTETLHREAKEELGIEFDPKDVELMHVSARPKHDDTGNRLDLYFRVKKWKGEPTIMEPHKCDDLKWVPLADFPENSVPHVRDGLRLAAKGVMYSEFPMSYVEAYMKSNE